MKTKKELNSLKEGWDTLNNKLAELTENELTQVTGDIGGYESDTGRVLLSRL